MDSNLERNTIMGTKEINRNMKCYLFFLVIILPNLVKSQSFDYEVKVLPNESTINIFDTVYTHQCILNLTDTNNVGAIEIMAVNAVNGSDVINFSFRFDNTATHPTKTTYKRKLNKIYIGLGNYSEDKLYYSVSITDTLNNSSSPVLWNNVTP